jgi:chromosome segregation ATPase
VSDTTGLQSELERKQAEIEELKQEIKGLKQEVHITLTTLNNIFAEYSSMFGEEVTRKDMSVEQILTAMESFSGTKVDLEADEPQAEEVIAEEVANDPDTVEDLELEQDEGTTETSVLDDMPLEEVSGSDDEPSWEDAFEESGEEMTKKPE